MVWRKKLFVFSAGLLVHSGQPVAQMPPPQAFLVATDENGDMIVDQYVFAPEKKRWVVRPGPASYGIYTLDVAKAQFTRNRHVGVEYCGTRYWLSPNAKKWMGGHVGLNHSIVLTNTPPDPNLNSSCTVRKAINRNVPGAVGIACQSNTAEFSVTLNDPPMDLPPQEICGAALGGITAQFIAGRNYSIIGRCPGAVPSSCEGEIKLQGAMFYPTGSTSSSVSLEPGGEFRLSFTVYGHREQSGPSTTNSPVQKRPHPTITHQQKPTTSPNPEQITKDRINQAIVKLNNDTAAINDLMNGSPKTNITLIGDKCKADEVASLKQHLKKMDDFTSGSGNVHIILAKDIDDAIVQLSSEKGKATSEAAKSLYDRRIDSLNNSKLIMKGPLDRNANARAELNRLRTAMSEIGNACK